MTMYTTTFRSKMVLRMTGARAVTATALAEEVGIAQPTLSRWLREAGDGAAVGATATTPSLTAPEHDADAIDDRPVATTTPPSAPTRITSPGAPRGSQDRFHLVMVAEGLGDAALGAFLRREGVHGAEITEWRQAMIEALAPPQGARSNGTADRRRVVHLERELARKDKALAEAAALLLLQKKSAPTWGARTTTRRIGAPDDSRPDR